MKVYTPEMVAFIRQQASGRSYVELTDAVNREFGTTFTRDAIKCKCAKLHICSNYDRSKPRGYRLYTPDIDRFIRENAKGITTAELTEKLNTAFGTSFKESQIRAYKHNHHITNGVNTQFKPGMISHNKGKKGYCAPGCEKGWFKKGHTPHNHYEVGTEKWTTDGYLKVKIAEPNVWVYKHIQTWEREHGKVPDGYAVIFLDQDHANCNIENLALISRSELAVVNRCGYVKSDPEATQAGILLARLKNAISKKQRTRYKPNTNGGNNAN